LRSASVATRRTAWSSSVCAMCCSTPTASGAPISPVVSRRHRSMCPPRSCYSAGACGCRASAPPSESAARPFTATLRRSTEPHARFGTSRF
jgi:hypothetical protein